MVYVRVSGRAIVNVHTANCEGAIGNYISLSKMYILRRVPGMGYEYSEEAVISGNMLKHWHAIETVELLKAAGYNAICEYCRRHVMFRSALNLRSELDYLKRCAIEDLHGFLDVNNNIRRESIIKFAFMIPVEDVASRYATITHNRVGVTKEGKIDENIMMVFKREHASALYGFQCLMDLAYVGRCQADPTKTININERKTRAKAALIALGNILTGKFGAASSRSLPIIKVTELICVVSKKPIPNLTHGFYYDYIEDSAARINSIISSGVVGKDEIKVYVVGERPYNEFKKYKIDVVKCSDVTEVFSKAAEDVDKWLT